MAINLTGRAASERERGLFGPNKQRAGAMETVTRFTHTRRKSAEALRAAARLGSFRSAGMGILAGFELFAARPGLANSLRAPHASSQGSGSDGPSSVGPKA